MVCKKDFSGVKKAAGLFVEWANVELQQVKCGGGGGSGTPSKTDLEEKTHVL